MPDAKLPMHLEGRRPRNGSDPASAIKCCGFCGRWGTRAFIPAPNGAELWVCENDRACKARVGKRNWTR